MDGFSINIEKATLDNEDYRRVIYTTPGNQIVLMSLIPGEDIPMETHDDLTQFIRVESGKGVALIGNTTHELYDGVAIDIPSGLSHEIINTSDDKNLKLYTVYSGTNFEHQDKLIQKRQPKSKKITKRQIFKILLL